MFNLVIVLSGVILAFTVFGVTLAWANHITEHPTKAVPAKDKSLQADKGGLAVGTRA